MSDIAHQSLLRAAEPLGEDAYFGALERLKGWLSSSAAPLSDHRKRFELYTHKKAKSMREYPDLRAYLRARWYPLYAWVRVELSGDYKTLTLKSGMASHTGADAGWGRILWTMAGRLFIYLIFALIPVFMLLYLLEDQDLGQTLAWISLAVAFIGLVAFEGALLVSARRAREPAFHAELERLHEGGRRILLDELELEEDYTLQVSGPGAVEAPAGTEGFDVPPPLEDDAVAEETDGDDG